MKSIISIAIAALSVSSATAFIPTSATTSVMRSTPLSMGKLDVTPEVESAIAEVREAASAFSEETQHFANGKMAVA